MIRKLIISLLVVFIASPYAKGEDMTPEKAVETYNLTIEKEGTSWQLLYNLGNAYAKMDKYGEAMLCYERALRLSPGNSKVENNLQYIAQKVSDRNRADLQGKQRSVKEESPTFFESIYRWYAVDHSFNLWAVIAAIFFLLAIAGAGCYMYSRMVVLRKAGFFGGIISLGLACVFIFFAISASRHFYSKDQAVVLEYKIPLLSEPKEDAAVSSTPLNAGTVVHIVSTAPEDSETPTWYKVRLNSSFSGWIKAEEIEVI